MGISVAILGATGAVGVELLSILAERQFPLTSLKLLASPRSAGTTLTFAGQELGVEPVTAESFTDVDLVFASAGASISRQWAEAIAAAGATMIDNSSAFRMDDTVPLVVPEVNPEDLESHQGIIANPNCTTILMLVALAPLHRVNPIQRIVAATYQSASGAGARAMLELETQARAILAGEAAIPEVLPHAIAFNLFLHNSPLDATGYVQEEMKMVNESRKMLHAPNLRINATCVRVPVLRAHAEALNVEFSQPFDPSHAKAILAEAAGVTLIDDWQNQHFPMPIDVSGSDDVAVGRIRQDISHDHCLDLWLCGDQIRKGAALNAVQIAEVLLAKNWLKQAALRP